MDGDTLGQDDRSGGKLIQQRFKLLSDDDGHQYLIPVEDESNFEHWLESIYENKNYKGKSFEDCRLHRSFTAYSFIDPQVEK